MKIAIIGYGHLGQAFAAGLLASGRKAADITVCVRSQKTADKAAHDGFTVVFSPAEAVQAADSVFLIVRPDDFTAVAEPLSAALTPEKTVVSFMAGWSIDAVSKALGGHSVIRAMPSLAIRTCSGIIGYTHADAGTAALLGALGFAFEIKEEEMPAVTAYSGCGIGFAAHILDAFAAAGEKLGFSRETAEKITALSFTGALDMGDYAGTAKAVATKGGVTEAGIIEFENKGLSAAIADGVQASLKKARG